MTSAELKYLLAIDALYDGTAGIKLTAIAQRMNVTKVSVYRAAERLEKNGYIRRDEKNKVVINDYGYEQLEKFNMLIQWISNHLREKCGVSPEIAHNDAIGAACEFSEASRNAIAAFVRSQQNNKEDAHDR